MFDTIYALTSARGKSGVSVVRVSGPQVDAVCVDLCGEIPVGRPALRMLRDASGQIIDQALVLRFADGASFTGEDVVEFQTHGSPAVLAALFARLEEFSEVRLAEPGEFTRRALENECLDLSQVEGLGDLIEAETEVQRQQALQLMRGGLTQKVEDWRRDLVRAAALTEATIDFADEDVPVDVSPEVRDLAEAVSSDLELEIIGSFAAERIRDGFEVAIVGPPNIGKSTLLNALAGRDAAITSEIAGTTRDVIEVKMDLGGLPVTLLDTAGLRETDDVIEGIGVQRAVQRANDADLRVFLTTDGQTDGFGVSIRAEDLILIGKADSGEDGGVSGKTGAGLDQLVQIITKILEKRASGVQSAVRQRHRVGMTTAVQYIKAALDLMDSDGEAELVSLELQSAMSALNSVIGRVGVEDLLDEIFASFCLGK